MYDSKSICPMELYYFPDEPGIYRCVNINDGRTYVGQSKSLAKRKAQHIKALREGTHGNREFQEAWDENGEYNYEWYAIETCPVKLLNERERYWIERYEAYEEGYNHTIGRMRRSRI